MDHLPAPTSRGRAVAFAVGVVIAWLVVPPIATGRSPLVGSGRFAVGVTTLTLVDTSRSTAPIGAFPGSPVRTLVTDVYYPSSDGAAGATLRDGTLDRSHGPYPLLVFAHGLSGARTDWSETLTHLASRGYVVGAPEFPQTNFTVVTGGTANLADLVHQPGDVSFVIDTLTGSGDAAGAPFASVVKAGAIGAFGHSYGGGTTLLLAFGGPLADARVRVAAAAAPFSCFFGAGMGASRSVPFLIMHGTSDAIVDPGWSPETFALFGPPKLLVRIVGGDHLGFVSDPAFAGVRDTDVAATLAALFAVLPGGFPAQSAALVAALTAAAPGADFTRCLARPTFPDPNTPRDPLIAAPRQVEITDVALTALFDGFLRHRAPARRFLARRRGRFAPEVRACAVLGRHARPCPAAGPAARDGAG